MAGLKLTPIILKEVNKYLTTPKKVRKFGFDDTTVKTGEDIERPQKALDREMFKDAEERFNQADGGRIGFYKGKSLAFLSNQIKKLYLEGRATKEINRILKFKNDRTTAIDNLIKAMKDPNLKTPVKITKKELTKRPKISGTTGKGLSPANIILNNPEAKKEFIKFANTKGNTILNSMEEAGKIAKKYAPEGSKISGYTSRSGFNDSGLRELITKKVQLGQQTLQPKVTERLTNVKQAIENADLPKTELKANSPAIIKLASNLDMSVDNLLSDVAMIKTGRVGDFNKKLFDRIPQKGFTENILKQQGFSKKTLNTLKSVENASFEISQSGTNLEHSLAKAFINQYNLPKKYFLTGERTTNFLNQFKAQHDNTLLNAARKYAQSAQTPKDYKEYKNVVDKTVKLVADKTGGYKIGYIDFDKNGKAFAVTGQESILKKVGDLGKNTTGLVKFIKNSVHHNKLFDAYKKNPNDPAFGTLRKEIKKGKYKFVREDDLEKSFNAIKNFNKKEDFISYYAKNPNDKIFQGLPMASGIRGGAGKAILAGTAGGSLLATALAADEVQGSGPGVADATGFTTGEKAAGAAALGSLAIKPVRKAALKTAAAALGPLPVAATYPILGFDVKNPIDRLMLGAELAGAPALVKTSLSATDKIKNPLLRKAAQSITVGSPKLALRLARAASPIGIASLAGEGLYQAGKFAKKRMDELQAMSPEQRQALRARQAAFAFEGAREGGIIGKKSGPPPVSGPMPHGLPYETKGVKKL